MSTTASAAGASTPSCSNTTDGIAVVLASQSGGTLAPACVTQQGNVLIIVLPSNTTGTTPLAVSTATTPTTLSTLTTPTTTPTITPTTTIAPEGNMSNVVDPRIDSYAKRQAVRDQYRGQIDEVTFNDELGDGVQLDTALTDAIAAFKRIRP